jgi:hypothetical protein
MKQQLADNGTEDPIDLVVRLESASEVLQE